MAALLVNLFKFRLQWCNNLFRQLVNDTLWIRRSQVQHNMCGSLRNIGSYALTGFSHVTIVHPLLDRTFDGFGVAPNSGTVPIKHLVLVAERLDGATGKIPDIPILSHDAQRQLLTASPYNVGRIPLLARVSFAASTPALSILTT